MFHQKLPGRGPEYVDDAVLAAYAVPPTRSVTANNIIKNLFIILLLLYNNVYRNAQRGLIRKNANTRDLSVFGETALAVAATGLGPV
jgi:hypothetical protein